MSTQDYDQIENIFNGSWKKDREENVKEFLAATGMSDEKKQAYSTDTIHSFERDGDSIKNQVQLESGMIFKSAFQLNVEREWKDKDNDPDFQVKSTTTFKDGVITHDIVPQAAGGGKRHITKMYVEGGELVAELSLPELPGVVAKRFYKKC